MAIKKMTVKALREMIREEFSAIEKRYNNPEKGKSEPSGLAAATSDKKGKPTKPAAKKS